MMECARRLRPVNPGPDGPPPPAAAGLTGRRAAGRFWLSMATTEGAAPARCPGRLSERPTVLRGVAAACGAAADGERWPRGGGPGRATAGRSRRRAAPGRCPGNGRGHPGWSGRGGVPVPWEAARRGRRHSGDDGARGIGRGVQGEGAGRTIDVVQPGRPARARGGAAPRSRAGDGGASRPEAAPCQAPGRRRPEGASLGKALPTGGPAGSGTPGAGRRDVWQRRRHGRSPATVGAARHARSGRAGRRCARCPRRGVRNTAGARWSGTRRAAWGGRHRRRAFPGLAVVMVALRLGRVWARWATASTSARPANARACRRGRMRVAPTAVSTATVGPVVSAGARARALERGARNEPVPALTTAPVAAFRCDRAVGGVLARWPCGGRDGRPVRPARRLWPAR